jgi:predicted site-specific integrase-resolvase
MKLNDWAKKQGINYGTCWRRLTKGTLPTGVKMKQLSSGAVLVTKAMPAIISTVGLYARISSSDQKNDLEGQLGRIVTYANSQG